ncbi:unnamed protein product [Clonostachys rosea f. rosea IK726]|uniref:Uncharacterized protein n=1 Tax=Clonostachys rosea f. rosea IK726 TaxID=1349383 RepID=A0ACA9UUA7_BIOOC|nr:unnamed protein product [Clonostachys rosea f. rosea IK726]
MSKNSTFQEPSYQPNMASPSPLASLLSCPSIDSYISSYMSYFFPCFAPEKSTTINSIPSFPDEKKMSMLHIQDIQDIKAPRPAAIQDDVVRHPYSSPAMAARHYQQGELRNMTTEQLIRLQHEAADDR